MRNGQTPIHIQRWAPADYYADEHVRLLILERDWATLTFYRHFIDASFAAGGDLPAEIRALSACVWMPVRDVSRPLRRLLGVLLFQEGDRIYQPRVRRDVQKEIEFRDSQALHGKKGGRPQQRLPLDSQKASLLDAKTPPTPTPAPAPAPAPKRAEIPTGIPADASPIVLTFSAQGKDGSWNLTQAQIDAWQVDYPGLDVLACCRKARAWSDANPDRRKSAKGTPKFLVNWLNREADSGRSGGNGAKPHATSGTRSSYPIDPETLAALQERERKARARASEGNDPTTAH